MTRSDARPVQPDPYADKLPHCTAFPPHAPLSELLRDLVGNCLSVDEDDTVPERYAVVVDCLHSAKNVPLARARYPGRPIIAVVARPDAVQVFEALSTNAEGIVCLTDPAATWRDCVNVVLGGGRWLDGPGMEVSLEHKYARYDVARSSQHSGDITSRTRTFVRQAVPDKFHR
jgi:hypothetical protein